MYVLSTLDYQHSSLLRITGFPEQGLKCPDLAEEYHGHAAHYQPSLGQKKVNTVGVAKKAHACQARLKSDVVDLNVHYN